MRIDATEKDMPESHPALVSANSASTLRLRAHLKKLARMLLTKEPSKLAA